ncbi:unnamed protein product [Candida verbasci]|uniref:BZIP domain-containing protein n=1 Tax=Candida verbasci TaxID=1227364 RepID=A0A9W4XAT6_9ASCO|nr:unnamed protein product [Candida verbasci]
MSDVKRSHSEVSSSPYDSLNETRKMTKAGRKPLETEPKSKRTAQNRAAQRAYRERKEKKMKELEDKVKLLEDKNIKAITESDFLKAQVAMLQEELSKFRGDKQFDFSTLKVGNLSATAQAPRIDSSVSSSSPENENLSSNKGSVSSKSSLSFDHGFSFDNPWSKDKLSLLKQQQNQENQQQPKLSHRSSQDSNNYSLSNLDELPDLTSSGTSPLNVNLTNSSKSTPSSNNYNLFEEKTNPFCAQLGQACGDRENPIPKFKKEICSTLKSPDEEDQSKHDFFNFDKNNLDDPLSFLNENNFDMSLAFDLNNNKPDSYLDLLTTEESIYDPFKDTTNNNINTNYNFNEFVKSSIPNEEKDENNNNDPDNEVVPAPESTMKCSEIWDRITAHPKYTELDIDGLCNELKAKAKCSEQGVVINTKDVNQLLQNFKT